MTVVLVARPPTPDAVPPDLAAGAPLDAETLADGLAAACRDTARAVADSSDDLLVNHPPADAVDGDDPAAALRDLLDDVAPDARYEVQVGSTHSAVVGNAVSHLLREEGQGSALVLRPDCPLLTRSRVDQALVRLRRDDVVLAPGGAGRVALAGFGATIDFADAYDPPALRTLAERAAGADRTLGFLDATVPVRAADDLAAVLTEADARRAAGRDVASDTTAWAQEVGLRVVGDGDGIGLEVE